MDKKRCPRCGETKPLDQFSEVKRRRDGRDNYCKPCRKEYNAIKYGDRKRGHALEDAFNFDA